MGIPSQSTQATMFLLQKHNLIFYSQFVSFLYLIYLFDSCKQRRVVPAVRLTTQVPVVRGKCNWQRARSCCSPYEGGFAIVSPGLPCKNTYPTTRSTQTSQNPKTQQGETTINDPPSMQCAQGVMCTECCAGETPRRPSPRKRSRSGTRAPPM